MQPSLRQLFEMRARSVLWLGQGFQRVQAVFTRVSEPHFMSRAETNKILTRCSLAQDVSNSSIHVCDTSVVKKKMVVTWGQSLHLGCFLKMPAVLASQTITWYHFSKEKGRYEITFRPDKYIETSEHGLVIIGVTEADAGRYDCHMGASLLCSYNVTVDAHRCAPPAKSNEYQKIYSDWCHEFEKYKSAMKTWERKQAVSRRWCERSKSSRSCGQLGLNSSSSHQLLAVWK